VAAHTTTAATPGAPRRKRLIEPLTYEHYVSSGRSSR
jgi:hypothetical protein